MNTSSRQYTLDDWKRDTDNVIQLFRMKLDDIEKELQEAREQHKNDLERFQGYSDKIAQQKEKISENEKTIAALKEELERLKNNQQ